MQWHQNEFSITTDKSKLQFDRIHQFLANSYWSPGVPRSVVEKAAANSLTFGLFHQQTQIGYARIITDQATFAYLADVYVEEDQRGKGLSKWLMKCVMEVLAPMNLRRVCLMTKDAHGLYGQFGFVVGTTPERFMEIRAKNPYCSKAD